MAPESSQRISNLIGPSTIFCLPMQNIIVEKPYRFIPPHRGSFLPSLIQTLRLTDLQLAKCEGVTSYEIRNADQLKESLRSRAGVLLAPNHCRYADPLAMGWLAREIGTHVFAMASWHLFNQSRFQAFAIRAMGGSASIERDSIASRWKQPSIASSVQLDH